MIFCLCPHRRNWDGIVTPAKMLPSGNLPRAPKSPRAPRRARHPFLLTDVANGVYRSETRASDTRPQLRLCHGDSDVDALIERMLPPAAMFVLTEPCSCPSLLSPTSPPIFSSLCCYTFLFTPPEEARGKGSLAKVLL